MKIRNVLVTGGAGFIGSNVARLLCDQGFSVTVLDNLSFGYRELVDFRCRFIEGDLADRSQLREAMRHAEAVMHFAASSIIARSFDDPLEFVQNNVLSGSSLLETMRECGVKHVVYSSSASVYGEPKHTPVREDDPKHPLQLYGATKLAFENVLEGYYRAFGINSVSLRYFNAYGPGDLQEPVTRAVPGWIRAALAGEPITLYWRGQQYRDYVFVEDIAAAHIQVLGLEGLHVYNIGSGEGVLMNDVLATLQELFPQPLSVIDAGERTGDPMRLVADISRITAETGWRPQTNLKEGLAKTIPFYEKTRRIWLGKT